MSYVRAILTYIYIYIYIYQNRKLLYIGVIVPLSWSVFTLADQSEHTPGKRNIY